MLHTQFQKPNKPFTINVPFNVNIVIKKNKKIEPKQHYTSDAFNEAAKDISKLMGFKPYK